MSTQSLLGALSGAGAPNPSGLVLGTVTASTTTSVSVTIDGALTATVAIPPADLKARLMQGASSLGARVIGTRVGSRFYITEIISGGSQDQWNYSVAGGGLPATLLTITVPAGVIDVVQSASGFSAAGGAVSYVYLMDSSTYGTQGFFHNQANVHHAYNAMMLRVAVTAGTHVFTVSTLTSSNDANDVFWGRFQWHPV